MITVLSGTVHKVGQVETHGKSFKVRMLVLTFPGDESANQRGDQFVEIQATYERMDKLDAVKVGDEVKVQVGVGGRQWNDKIFNRCELVDVKVTKAAVAQPAAPAKSDSWADEVPF